jgi:hypothetical protein
VYEVLYDNADEGVSVAVLFPALYTTVVATGAPPDGVNVNVDPVTVAASIASLKDTTTVLVTATLVAAFAGTTFVTVGGVTSAPATVVNVELNAVSAFVAMSFAELATFTV